MGDLLIGGGLQRGVPLSVLIAQNTLPWLTWALLAPGVVGLLRAAPITPGNAFRPILFHGLIAVFVAGTKLLLSTPAAELFIWRPLDVSFADGAEWLFANRLGPNVLMYWLFVAVYTASGHFRRNEEPSEDGPTSDARVITDRLPITEGQRTFFVKAGAIDYVEASDNYVTLHVGDRAYKIRETLSSMADRLPPPHFIRVHRSYLVNVERIREVQPWYRGEHVILLEGGGKVVTSRTYRESIRRLLHLDEI